MGRVFGGELSETEDTSGLAPHMVSSLSLKYGKTKDTRDESRLSATPITAHRLRAFNTALINPPPCNNLTPSLFVYAPPRLCEQATSSHLPES